MIGRFIGGGVAILIGATLIPTVIQQVKWASSNITNPAYLLGLKFIPLFFGLSILFIAIATIAGAIREAGIMEDEEVMADYEKTDRKQTYEEYVRERLRTERMMKYGWIGRWI